MTNGWKLVHLSLIAVLVALPAAAGDGDWSLRVVGNAAAFVSGDAGSGADAPLYEDVFDTGLGVALEIHGPISRRFGWLAGAGYEVFDGNELDGIAFSKLEELPVYAGLLFHIKADHSRWDPYVRVDAGTSRLSSVDVSFGTLSARYWEQSWVVLAGCAGGLEYRRGSWGAVVEVGIRYQGKPDPALGDPSIASEAWVAPVSLGIAWHF